MPRLYFGQITNRSENSNGSVPVGQSEFTLKNWVQVQKHCWTFVTKFIKRTHSLRACFPYLIKKWPTFVEPRTLLLCTQEPAIGPYSWTRWIHSTSTLYLVNQLQYYPFSYIWVFQVVSFLQFFPPRTLYAFLFFSISIASCQHMA
jgi:hypothetical protein